jgi:hypothetical protein
MPGGRYAPRQLNHGVHRTGSLPVIAADKGAGRQGQSVFLGEHGMGGRAQWMSRGVIAVGIAWGLIVAPVAHAEFPYKPQGAPSEYERYFQPAGANQTPSDLGGSLTFMYAATAADPGIPPRPDIVAVNNDKRELNGVRGAHLADAKDVDQAWRTSTGRPDVAIAVTDSGIKWNDPGTMRDIRFKTRVSTGETPRPQKTRAQATEPGEDCATYTGTGLDGRDLNRDGVFNVKDYACDMRVSADPANGAGATFEASDGATREGKPMLDPQDVLIAFSDGKDDDGNGYPDDMVGWDFLDDDNDPYDDVQYGHGSGEARDSNAEANNGGGLGSCPNCMVVHLRVGTSFVADVNRFAQAAIYATDNDVLVIQDALGTLNKSRLGRQAVKYAWDHGVTTIASAADEAAQHNNWPSTYPYVILVNSVTHENTAGTASYLQFNGCTNFNAKIDLAIPSVSCSSDATGRAAGMAGLIHSAARNAAAAGKLDAHPTCKRTDGRACLLSAPEVKQLMASGIFDGTPQADDVNFSQDPVTGRSMELSCNPNPTPECTDPFLSAPNTRVGTSPPRPYPARKGHDQFYGYGRVNMDRVLKKVAPKAADARTSVPPEVTIESPEWFGFVDPKAATSPVKATVWARGRAYTCRVLVAPGSYPGEDDFKPVASSLCDGQTARSMPIDGTVAQIDVGALKASFPPGRGGFDGVEHGAAGTQPYSGRPSTRPYGFVIKVTATLKDEPLLGQDRRAGFLHRDSQMIDGFPKQLDGDGEASPLLVDLDGDNRNELIVANSDGEVHAWRRDGSELPGFPVKTDPLPRQTGRAFTSGAIPRASGAVLATPAAGDLDHDGTLELVVADLEGKITVFDGAGKRVSTMHTNVDFSGRPRTPFVNERRGMLNRTQLGILGAPVLADLDGNDGGKLEIVAAALDRHTYAFNDDGTAVPGWPVLTVDRAKVASIAPGSDQITFKEKQGADFDQGALVDTPAVGDIDGAPGGRPEVIVGSNESYEAGADGGLNTGEEDRTAFQDALGQALAPANGRLFAIRAGGEPDDDRLGGASPYLPGWPFKVGILQAGVLPLVGEGVTGYPVIGNTPCGADTKASPRVGTIPAAGLAYLLNPDGQSCLGREPNGRDRSLRAASAGATDTPFLAAFGHPAFADLGDGSTFLAPAAGVQRALDVVLPEYQGGHDYLVAWRPATGTVKEGWPAEVNDLSFLTGPSAGDIDPSVPGEEIVTATSSDDLQGFTANGSDVPGYPKLTGDWTVANPTLGSFGALETEGAKKVVVNLTRSGRVMVYETKASACSPSSWPRFHHDNANSGDARRDAIIPGTPTGTVLSADGRLRFLAPGDDLLCGRATRFEVRTSGEAITPASFARATEVTPAKAGVVDPGTAQELALPADRLQRYVAVRAVDDQGNVGRPAVIDRSGAKGCVRRVAQLKRIGIGAMRLARSRTTLQRRFGRKVRRTRSLSVCVTGGGRETAAFTAKGATRVIATTGPRHRIGHVRPGMSSRAFRSAAPRRRHLSPRVWRISPSSRVVARVRKGKVQALAVVPRSVLRDRHALRVYLRRAGV